MLRALAAALLTALMPSGALGGDAPPAARSASAERRTPPAGEPTLAARLVPEGRLEAQGARIEILGKPVRVGENRELPEGFIRVEEAGIEDHEVGSFSIVPARTLRPSSAAPTAAAGPDAAGIHVEDGRDVRRSVTTSRERPCRVERAAYLRELWKASGIEVADPEALIEGLESGRGAASGFYWFALATDPFRPLAWSSALRARADALARCVREE